MVNLHNQHVVKMYLQSDALGAARTFYSLYRLADNSRF